MFSYSAETGSRSSTPHSNQTSPIPRRTSVDIQSQPPTQRRTSVENQSQRPIASLDNQSEQPAQASGSDTNNPEESEDEGLGLNGFTEADNVNDMFKDMTGMVVEIFLENKVR